MILDLNVFELFDVYNKEVRSVLKFTVPVWHSTLTRNQCNDIESIQKLALKLILQHAYQSYSKACKFFSTSTLDQRREEICLRFALKNLKAENSLFEIAIQDPRLRTRRTRVKDFRCRTSRFQRSSLPYMANLINNSDHST